MLLKPIPMREQMAAGPPAVTSKYAEMAAPDFRELSSKFFFRSAYSCQGGN